MRHKLPSGGWIVTIPVSLMALAYLALFFLPRMRDIHDMRHELQQREDYIARADKLRPAAERVGKELTETLAYCNAWQDHCIDEHELEALFSKIGQLAEANGARILRFEPQPPVAYERVRKIPVIFSFAAPFASVQQLARGLEELQASNWVDHFKIETSSEDGKLVKAELNLVLFADNPEKSD